LDTRPTRRQRMSKTASCPFNGVTGMNHRSNAKT
jgi:hypothetical protein